MALHAADRHHLDDTTAPQSPTPSLDKFSPVRMTTSASCAAIALGCPLRWLLGPSPLCKRVCEARGMCMSFCTRRRDLDSGRPAAESSLVLSWLV